MLNPARNIIGADLRVRDIFSMQCSIFRIQSNQQKLRTHLSYSLKSKNKYLTLI